MNTSITNDWKSKTCEECKFRVENHCRRFPPTADEGTALTANYPVIQDGFHKTFLSACAEYQPEDVR